MPPPHAWQGFRARLSGVPWNLSTSRRGSRQNATTGLRFLAAFERLEPDFDGFALTPSLHQRRQLGRGMADPAGQGRAVDLDPLAGRNAGNALITGIESRSPDLVRPSSDAESSCRAGQRHPGLPLSRPRAQNPRHNHSRPVETLEQRR
jgi:hypothetical protein